MNIDKKIGTPEIDPENELYYPNYIKSVKEEDDPETIDFKGTDPTEDEEALGFAEGDVQKKDMEDYNNNYLKE